MTSRTGSAHLFCPTRGSISPARLCPAIYQGPAPAYAAHIFLPLSALSMRPLPDSDARRPAPGAQRVQQSGARSPWPLALGPWHNRAITVGCGAERRRAAGLSWAVDCCCPPQGSNALRYSDGQKVSAAGNTSTKDKANHRGWAGLGWGRAAPGCPAALLCPVRCALCPVPS